MARVNRRASVVWNGPGDTGSGAMSTQSGRLKDSRYSFSSRFADGLGTNPEELIAAAHAGCFTMALAFQLGAAGYVPDSLQTDARLSMEEGAESWTIATIVLTLRARIPGIPVETFLALAEAAKANCPVSKVLNATITLDAKLDG